MISLKRSQAFSDAILCESGSVSDIELVHAYALSVEAGWQSQGTLPDGDFVFLSPSDKLDVRRQQRPRRDRKIVKSLEPVLVA